MKKIVKLLPIALALTLISSAAYAETVTGSKTATSTQLINVDKFINITHVDGSSVEEASAGFNADYSEITLDKAMTTTFKVVTNNPDEAIKLTATDLAGGGQVNAIYGTDANTLNLVFTNNGEGTRAAEATAVTNITGGSPAVASNANAIAFSLKPTITYDKASAGADPKPTKEADGVKYTLQNGIYTFTYTLGQTGLPNTFSTHDADGKYKATLTLSQVGT